jgi:F-type H+-transporting ATPase subunit b
MESLIEVFHLDIKLFLAQVVNFAIVFGVIYFFALKPLTAVMGERTKKIEKSLEDAKAIEEKLAETREKYHAEMVKAKKEASLILERATEAAEEKRKEAIAKAKEEIGEIINKEKAQMQMEKAAVLKEIKKEVADLVAAGLEKVLGEKVDEKKDKEIIKRSIIN